MNDADRLQPLRQELFEAETFLRGTIFLGLAGVGILEEPAGDLILARQDAEAKLRAYNAVLRISGFTEVTINYLPESSDTSRTLPPEGYSQGPVGILTESRPRHLRVEEVSHPHRKRRKI